MADARGEYWYFEPGTDASKITVPELRSILLKHGVTYPSSAKKPQLVGLFNDVVAPQAAQVQKAHARTKRSTRGIQDVPSSSASTVTTEDTEDETLHAPPPPSTRRPVRRSARSPPAELEDVAPAPRARTPARAVPAKHSRTSELDVDDRPAVRRTRKSETPAIKAPSVDPEAWHKPAADSPFTQDNPFQSGSSPAMPETASRDRRRKTMGFEQKERRKSEANRRRTFQPNSEQLDEGIVVPSRREFDVADPRVKTEEHESADAGEEFTPEEQLELVRARAAAGEVDILPPRPRKQSRKATGALKSMGFSMLFLISTAVLGLYRQEKIEIGFCGIGRDGTSLIEYGVPEPLSDLLGDYTPQCEPCPPHAQCFRNLQLTCDRDFIRKEHPLSLNGFWPLPATCEPDSEKTKKVKAITNRAVSMLRTRRAQYECGEEDADGQVVKSPEMTESELKQRMAEQKSKSTTFKDFNELFDRAFPELLLQEEVVESKDGTTSARLLTSRNLSKLSLACSIRRSVRESLERYFFQIVAVFAILITTAYGKYSFTTNRAMETRAKQLASDVFDRLAEHAALSMQEPGAYPDKGISMAQLRDDVLRNEFSGKRRQKLWERVQKKVEFNSNIRAAVKTTNSGDVARTWEWIGPTKMLEDGRSNKRESGRFSFGMGSSPPSGANDMSSVQKWDEGRPIY